MELFLFQNRKMFFLKLLSIATEKRNVEGVGVARPDNVDYMQ